MKLKKLSCFSLCSCCLVGAKVTLLRPGLWPSRLPQPCRTCSLRPTKLWPTAGRPRQPCTWRGKLNRHSAGLTTPRWTTVAWVRSPRLLSLCPTSIPPLFTLLHSNPLTFMVAAAARLLARHFEHMLTFHKFLSTLSFVQLVLAAVFPNLDVVAFVYGCDEGAMYPEGFALLCKQKKKEKSKTICVSTGYLTSSRAVFFFLPFYIFR